MRRRRDEPAIPRIDERALTDDELRRLLNAESDNSASAVRAKAINKSKIDPPNIARSTINLRPRRSARAPHTGAESIMVKDWAEYTSPASSSILKEVWVPKTST